jgi:transposase
MDDTAPDTTIGIDVGDKQSVFCVLDAQCKVVEEGGVATTPKALLKAFRRRVRARVALEAGTHSAWMSDLLTELGHDVVVANPRQLELITKSDRKNDRNDARLLARLARVDPELLSPIKHRAAELRADLAIIRARDALVQTRTKLINTVRGLLKSAGERISKCSSESFHKVAGREITGALRPAAAHVVKLIAQTTEAIKAHDKMVEELASEKYPETSLLEPVAGIGTLTALTFVLTVGEPHRFKKSRDVGAYFGLVPRQQQSSGSDPQLRISKAGDGLVRKLLVGSANYTLGRFGPESNLRSWGLGIAARGGKNGKKRAVVAVARKLAVLLHRLWVTGEAYEPLRRPPAKSGGAANTHAKTRRTEDGPAPDSSCGELHGRPTRGENAQKRPRKGGRVSPTLADHTPLHTTKSALRRAAAPRGPAAAKHEANV